MVSLNDKQILQLFSERSEAALQAVSEAWGRLGICVAQNILHSREDAEECVSDALHVLWESIPPASPDPLLPYFLRTVRNISLNRRRAQKTKRRDPGQILPLEDADVLGELALFDESEADSEQIRQALDEFLALLSEADRILFLRRYWFEDSLADIAGRLGITENNARVRLSRCRNKLRQILAGKGITV